MSIEHTNFRGKTYYLHGGKTRKGNPRYYFSMKPEGERVDFIPNGYEIYENPEGQVFLRKTRPRIISEEEQALVEKGMEEYAEVKHWKLDIKKDAIIIYTADREADGDKELEALADGEREAEGLYEALGERDVLGERDADIDELGLNEAEGLRDALGDKEALADAEGDCDALGERLALGDIEADGERNEPGETPNQSTPGLGPGCPSSYRNILLASSKASLGRRDLSISVITPFFQLVRVKNWGSGNCFCRLLLMVRGILETPFATRIVC